VLDLPPEASPLELFRRLQPEEAPSFLDSVAGPDDLVRFSALTWGPAAVLETDAAGSRARSRSGSWRRCADPFAALGKALARAALAADGSPFPAIVAIGYLGYELNGRLERLPPPPREDLALPGLRFVFPRFLVLHDHPTGANVLVTSGSRGRSALERARSAVASVLRRAPRGDAFRLAGALRSDLDRRGYVRAVSTVREHVLAGDLFQANLSRRIEGRFTGDALALHERLRRHNPAPFSAALLFGDRAVLSTSPERFLRIEGDRVETRPIKGTRPRTGDAAVDARAVADLESSGKDRAELTMIVDVERNDLSRVCRPGTVRVPRLASTEAYARVFHRVATVEGRLEPGVGVVDALRATFPGGSITGAPKIRAMEILAGLERTARGPYTGAIGWLGAAGSADLAVAIRTVVLRGSRLAFRVGGGIVADSDPEAGGEETNAKARAIEEAVRSGGGG